jgi:hypothetical protein
MSGEMLLVRRALVWGVLAACAGAALAFVLRGADGATSVAIGAGLVLGNTLIAAGLAWGAGRLNKWAGALVALPSFALRMALLFGALQALKGRPFIDEPSFVAAFALAVTATLVLEARTWKRTPWVALTLKGDN